MIKCSIQELILIDLLIKANITKTFRAEFTEDDIRAALVIGEKKLKERKWFENNKYSDEFVEFTKQLKIYESSNKEITLNNLIYRFRDESEFGVLLTTLTNDEVEVRIISKSEYFVLLTKKLPVMLGNTDKVSDDLLVIDMLKGALASIAPQFQYTYIVDNKLIAMNVVREVKDKIIVEDIVSNTIKEVNSKYLRSTLLSYLEVSNG